MNKKEWEKKYLIQMKANDDRLLATQLDEMNMARCKVADEMMDVIEQLQEELNQHMNHNAKACNLADKLEGENKRMKIALQDVSARVKEIKYRNPQESQKKIDICEDILSRIVCALKGD